MAGVPAGGGVRQIRDLFARGAVGHLTDAQLLDRFTRGHDAEDAFEALVLRHGPAVLRVCRRALGDPNDAEDAFQATFLVLARRARSVGRPDSLASWLHGVALRVSRKAKVADARRRRHEQLAAGGADPDHESRDDVVAMVREEVARLPEPLRAPVLLCYFEGRTYGAAARHLRVTEGTIRGRLARARDRLRGRLSGRGVDAPAVLPVASATRPVIGAVPPVLARATTRAAMSIARGCGESVGVSAIVAELTEGVLTTMIMTKLKTAAVVVAALGLAAAGAAAFDEQAPLGAGTGGCQIPPEPPGPVPGADRSEGDGAASVAAHPAGRPGTGGGAPGDATGPHSHLAMTLEAAIERTVRESLDLRSRFSEIPRERADILTAGLRNNPTFYADGQLVPYGLYTRGRSGGQTQYDVNVSYPFDVSRKRQARNLVATRAERVLEAQYQDAVRLLIGKLYTRFVDVQVAQESVRRAGESWEELGRLLSATVVRAEKGVSSRGDVNRVKVAHEAAYVLLDILKSELERRKQALGALLELSAREVDRLEVVGSLDIQPIGLPAVDELVRLTLDARPDLVSYRLGLQRSPADLDLQRAVRTSDVHTLDQSATLEDEALSGSKGPTSREPGLSGPVPVDNGSPNSAARSRPNTDQPRAELTAMERQVISEVTRSRQEYESSLAEVRRTEQELLPAARLVRDETARVYEDGRVGVVALLESLKDYRQVENRYIDLLDRFRRASLDLNTAVAIRIIP